MRAGCQTQRVIVFRSIHTGEVERPRRGSKPARVTLMAKRYMGRAEFFAPPTFGWASR